jgi:hypothetical protein
MSSLASRALKTVSALFQQRKSWIIAAVLITVLLIPQPSHGQFGFFGAIAGAISNVIGGGLDAVTEIMGAIEEFQRTVVWPEDLIDVARAAVNGVRAIFRDIQAIGDVAVASATLPVPGQLERTLLSGNPATIPQVSAQYADVYLTVPLPDEASPEVRNLIDMTDAVAQAAMKRAITIDAIADLELFRPVAAGLIVGLMMGLGLTRIVANRLFGTGFRRSCDHVSSRYCRNGGSGQREEESFDDPGEYPAWCPSP